MTPENARLRPELFLHDACLPDEFRPVRGRSAAAMTPDQLQEIHAVWQNSCVQTHWDGCHLVHVRCVVVKLLDEIERLQTENRELLSNFAASAAEVNRLKMAIRTHHDMLQGYHRADAEPRPSDLGLWGAVGIGKKEENVSG
jgi:hypothetical protein